MRGRRALGAPAAASRRAGAALGAPAAPSRRPGGQPAGPLGRSWARGEAAGRPRRSAPRVVTSAEPVLTAPVPEPQPGTSTEPINWYQQWYPVAITGDLDPSRPTPLKLLGKSLVLWRAGSGAWSCLEDRCPHRLAPLSEGRVEPKTGNLMCSYHGWEFDAGGACAAIPQIGDERARAAALGSKRSCVASYPVKEEGGLLWVWADASPGAAAAAAAAPMAVIPENSAPAEWAARTGWFMRDVPCSMETVVENVTDPCHAPFTHHGVQGRRDQEKGTSISAVRPPSPAGFLCAQEGNTPFGKFSATFEFTAPCLVKYHFPKFGRVMAVYIIPSAPGWTRMITRFYSSTAPTARRPGLFGLLRLVMEAVESNRVLEHALMRNQVLDGDNYILHLQERILLAENGGHEAWRQHYFMPGQSDTGITSWRSWLDRFGRALPVLPKTLADLPPEMSRREALDRYSQHTQHCPDCRKALARIDAALPLVAAAGIALLAAAAIAAATGAAPPLGWRVLGAAAGAAAAALLHRKLSEFRTLFIFTDYVHAERN
ncbi:hypothetical protein Rsub_09022 [Raphidocelis subcapitata]|uniref:Rieske domain-containing protein n=1 Tax=Raphidocelis subcapitata TaxID=307507 RepID=A0A2V0PDA4_9CHLO|nr:hypothetical protein Rsub_09022 [Raphidocelis subcapitata]|eukprot:GBF96942.1 hypothetical protein Rsub_09022 [Raphidocelis subcapitata]